MALTPNSQVQDSPKPTKILLKRITFFLLLGGVIFVAGHYVFDPPTCTEQQAQTCSCPLW